MATNYIKISNGKVLDECDFYEYLKTAKGFCCEKGWSWENETTSEVKTGRDWLAYFNEHPPSLCEPFFTILVDKTEINAFQIFIGGNDVFDMIVDYGGGIEPRLYEDASEYDIDIGELPNSQYNIRFFIDNVPTIVNISSFNKFSEIRNFTFQKYPTGMISDNFPNFTLVECDIPKEDLDDLLCYLADGGISGANIDFTLNHPAYAPSPSAILCINELGDNGNVIYY